MIVVTAGKKYLDIDAYASMLAYRELLRATTNEEVFAFSTTKFNQTVPPILRKSKYQLDKMVNTADANFILVDVSNPDFFDTFVDTGRILEIIDHHPGYEGYWKNHTAIKSQIETIGAVCTQIYERFVNADRTDLLDKDLRKLLSAGILDNTINLKSKITTERDHRAYSELLKIGNLGQDWHKEYFRACENEQFKDLKGAILGDMKAEWVSPLLPEAIGQIILFNREDINNEILSEVFSEYDKWIINVISLEDGRSYLYCDGKETKKGLEKLFGIKSNYDSLVVLDDFILRKELLKRAIGF